MIESVSCIRFIQRSYERDYVEVINDGKCSSDVGRKGGRQTLSLSGYLTKGIIAHEFLHLLGFSHMHSSHDRDDHVRVNYDNIQPGREHNFKIRHIDARCGTPYDFESVMHYDAYAFSKNGLPTIQPLDPNVPIRSLGQRDQLSYGDIMRLRLLYNC